jgi:hypothetical protein
LRSAPAGESGRAAERGFGADKRDAAAGAVPAPAAVRGGEQESSGLEPGVRRRRSELRSKGRRGVERRSDRANERAAGPKPYVAKKPAKGVDARRRGGPSQGLSKRPEREAKPSVPKVEKLANPAPIRRPALPERAPERAALAPPAAAGDIGNGGAKLKE